MCDVFDIQWIGESSLHKNFDQFYRFYRMVWAQPHAYIVMNARRCFNLHHVYLDFHAAGKKQTAADGRIISNNALLLCAGDIAGFFRTHGRFPSILIADDLVLHGRGISKLLADLEELIVWELRDSDEEMGRVERHYIRRSLADAIDIFTFAANKQPLLISDAYLRNLHWETQLYTREIRSLSQQISSFLQRVDVPNTSYVLSYHLPSQPNPPAGWRTQKWSYRGITQFVFFYPKLRNNFLPTVRLRSSYGPEDRCGVWLTSLTLLGELTAEDLTGICRRMEEVLPAKKYGRVRAILQKRHPLLQKQQAQLISFVLSAIYLQVFLSGLGIPFRVKDSDLGKIARNFGGDIEGELEDLLTDPALLAVLCGLLEDSLCVSAMPFTKEMMEGSGLPQSREAINYFLEDYFYNVGMSAERSAYEAISTNRLRAKRDLSTVSLEELLCWKTPPLHWDNRRNWKGGTLKKLSSMLSMMDNGLMAMNFECKPASGGVYTSLKAGELATFSLPRRLHLFIPALALVEQNSWQADMEPAQAVKRFIRFLPEPDTAGSGACEKETAGLAFLKSQGDDFVDLLYECGQTLAGWDIDLATMDDWREEEQDGSYLAFVRRETGRQDFYLDLARRFLKDF